MKLHNTARSLAAIAGVVYLAGACATTDVGAMDGSISIVAQAVNTFQNGQATKGAPMTVDVKGPVTITDDVELPGFAFSVYDIDFSSNSLTMTLVAELEKLQITQYDETTFDRYYYAFDQPVATAGISASSDGNFAASVEIMSAGTTVSTAGAFVDGLSNSFTFDNGGLIVTVGEGTDLAKIKANGGSLTVDFAN